MAAKLEDSKHKLQIWLINDSLTQLASHGLFDVHVKATGDVHIDDHHTNEDVPLLLEQYALGDRKGINRFGNFSAPLDEALIHVSLDIFPPLLVRFPARYQQLAMVEHHISS
ncbi:Imidazoleglycerol-phosphate dehydratase [Glycine soja]|nr:Imidazoleglycerol-phosphate dehydratase [Glycine soja]